MVRSVLALSVLMSLLLLAALWSMEDPQPWVPAPSETADPADAVAPKVGSAPAPGGTSPLAVQGPKACVGANLLGTLVGESGGGSFSAVDLGDRVIPAGLGDALECGVVRGIEPEDVMGGAGCSSGQAAPMRRL